MNYDRYLSFAQEDAIRADLQARADMLEAATRDFERSRRCMVGLESTLVRCLILHREVFEDRFCTHALLKRLPLPEVQGSDKAEGRLRERIAYSRALRPASFHALSLRRGDLGGLASAEAQLAIRVHTRAFSLASDTGWELVPLDAAKAALAAILKAEDALGGCESALALARLQSPVATATSLYG